MDRVWVILRSLSICLWVFIVLLMIFYFIMSADYMYMIPIVYVLSSTAASIAYVRSLYTVPEHSICLSCPLNGFCTRLRLNRIMPPARYVGTPTRKEAIILFTIVLLGYVIVSGYMLIKYGLCRLMYFSLWFSIMFLVAYARVILGLSRKTITYSSHTQTQAQSQ